VFYSIIYSLGTQKMNQGSILMHPGDNIEEIYIVERGIV